MRIPPRIYIRCSLCPAALCNLCPPFAFSPLPPFLFSIVPLLFLHRTIPFTSGFRDIYCLLRASMFLFEDPFVQGLSKNSKFIVPLKIALYATRAGEFSKFLSGILVVRCRSLVRAISTLYDVNFTWTLQLFFIIDLFVRSCRTRVTVAAKGIKQPYILQHWYIGELCSSILNLVSFDSNRVRPQEIDTVGIKIRIFQILFVSHCIT